MDAKKRVMATAGILVVLVIVFYLITSTITGITGYFVSDSVGNDEIFIECLKEKNVVLYINSEDVALGLDGVEAMDFLEGVEVFNCYRDDLACVEKGIGEFPSWIIEGGKINGDVSVYELAEFSGCDLR